MSKKIQTLSGDVPKRMSPLILSSKDMETTFDSILDRALPLILFLRNDTLRNELATTVGKLYMNAVSLNQSAFDEREKEIAKLMDECEIGNGNEGFYIERFWNRNKTYGQRFDKIRDELDALKHQVQGIQRSQGKKTEKASKDSTSKDSTSKDSTSKDSTSKRQTSEERKAKRRVYEKAHRDEINATAKAYYQFHKAEINAKKKAKHQAAKQESSQ